MLHTATLFITIKIHICQMLKEIEIERKIWMFLINVYRFTNKTSIHVACINDRNIVYNLQFTKKRVSIDVYYCHWKWRDALIKIYETEQKKLYGVFRFLSEFPVSLMRVLLGIWIFIVQSFVPFDTTDRSNVKRSKIDGIMNE